MSPRAVCAEVWRANRVDGYGTSILGRLAVLAVVVAAYVLSALSAPAHAAGAWVIVGIGSAVFGALVVAGLVGDYKEAARRLGGAE